MLTVTGLWATLGIGDGTNKFTREPEWVGTNGVTNEATYGEYPWRIYATDLEERYKVLNMLKVFKAARRISHKGGGFSTDNAIGDLLIEVWTNAATGEYVLTYGRTGLGGQAYDLQYDVVDKVSPPKPSGYSYYTNQLVWDDLSEWYWPEEAMQDGVYIHKLSYSDYKTFSAWFWFVGAYSLASGPPPFTPYPGGYVDSTEDDVGRGAGEFWAAIKYVWAWRPSERKILGFYWSIQAEAEYSTWVFDSNYEGSAVSNVSSLYIYPTLPWIAYTNTWKTEADSRFEELDGKTLNEYTRLEDSFFVKSGGVWSVEFGSDQFGFFTTASTQPPFPTEAPEDMTYDQFEAWEGGFPHGRGRIRGSRLYADNYVFLKDFIFQYATNRYW